MTRSEWRATLVVVVLALVGVVALWPRGDDAAGSGPGTPPVASTPVDADAIARARAEAALAPCPVPAPGAGATPVADLDGARAPCLGAPGEVDLAPALAGRSTLVNLWASWCGPCREELPALRDYAAEPGAVDVLGVDVEDDPVAALALLSELDVRYPSVTDPDRSLARRLGAPPVLPASLLIRADGAVVPLPPEVYTTPGQVRAAVDRAGGSAP